MNIDANLKKPSGQITEHILIIGLCKNVSFFTPKKEVVVEWHGYTVHVLLIKLVSTPVRKGDKVHIYK